MVRGVSTNKVLFFSIIISVFLISFVNANGMEHVETHDAQGSGYMDTSLTINVLAPGTAALNEDVFVYASFYNRAGKLQDNGTAVCLFGILSPSLDRVVIYEEDNMTFLNGDTIQVVSIDGSFFSEIGEYTYNYNCDGNPEGGYFHGSIHITSNGEDMDNRNVILPIILIVFAVLIYVVGLSFSKEHWILRTFFNFAATATGLIALNSAKAIAAGSQVLVDIGNVGLMIGIVIVSLFFLYMFVYAFIEIINVFKEKKGVRWNY